MWEIGTLAGALLTGWGTYRLMRKGEAGKVFAAFGALLFAPIGAWITYSIGNSCELSAFLESRLRQSLAPAELATLEPAGWFCSTTYTFVRGGEAHTAIVVDGWIRPKIFIGNRHSP